MSKCLRNPWGSDPMYENMVMSPVVEEVPPPPSSPVDSLPIKRPRIDHYIDFYASMKLLKERESIQRNDLVFYAFLREATPQNLFADYDGVYASDSGHNVCPILVRAATKQQRIPLCAFVVLAGDLCPFEEVSIVMEDITFFGPTFDEGMLCDCIETSNVWESVTIRANTRSMRSALTNRCGWERGEEGCEFTYRYGNE